MNFKTTSASTTLLYCSFLNCKSKFIFYAFSLLLRFPSSVFTLGFEYEWVFLSHKLVPTIGIHNDKLSFLFSRAVQLNPNRLFLCQLLIKTSHTWSNYILPWVTHFARFATVYWFNCCFTSLLAGVHGEAWQEVNKYENWLVPNVIHL